jgi:hypothetical protein
MKNLYLAFLLLACSNINDRKDSISQSDEQGQQNIRIEVYAVTSGSFGYAIYIEDRKIIDQPSIPGLSSNIGFNTIEKAQKTAEFIVSRIRKNRIPPTITVEELDSLNVLK